MKFHVAGTVAAAALALEYGWAINLGGGQPWFGFGGALCNGGSNGARVLLGEG